MKNDQTNEKVGRERAVWRGREVGRGMEVRKGRELGSSREGEGGRKHWFLRMSQDIPRRRVLVGCWPLRLNKQ